MKLRFLYVSCGPIETYIPRFASAALLFTTTLRKQRPEQEDMSTQNKRTRILQHKNPNGINSKSHVFWAFLIIWQSLYLFLLTLLLLPNLCQNVFRKDLEWSPFHRSTWATPWSGDNVFKNFISHKSHDFFLNQPSPKIHRPRKMRFGPFFAGHPFPGFCLQRHADLLFRDSECNSYRSRPVAIVSKNICGFSTTNGTALPSHGRLEWHELVSDLETSRGLEIVHTSRW